VKWGLAGSGKPLNFVSNEMVALFLDAYPACKE
jgi:hypothetical protein